MDLTAPKGYPNLSAGVCVCLPGLPQMQDVLGSPKNWQPHSVASGLHALSGWRCRLSLDGVFRKISHDQRVKHFGIGGSIAILP